MQDYKTWVGKWLEVSGAGGKLARAIHNDNQFPLSSDKKVIHKRLEQLNIPEGSMLVFLSSWKDYEKDQRNKPREVNLESKLVHEVEKRGGLCWKFTSPGTVGVPDRVVVAPGGKIAFVEMKAPEGKLRPIQRKRANELKERGASWYLLKSNQDIWAFIQEMFGDEI